MSDILLHEFDDSRPSVIASAVPGHARHVLLRTSLLHVDEHRYGRDECLPGRAGK